MSVERYAGAIPALLARARNRAAKLLAGLRPFNESVWPGVRNDLFVAHESIYLFASRFAAGARVLDAACGTGYGAQRLLEAGALSVLGLDIDRRTVRFASRRYRSPGLRFAAADLETCALPAAAFDLAVSSNTLEHLNRPGAFLERLRAAVVGNGRIVVALPPIYSEADLATHRGIAYHRTSHSVREWHSLFASLGWSVGLYGQRLPPEHGVPDFGSPHRSRLSPDQFTFEPLTLDAFYAAPSIGAVYVLSRAA